MRKGLGEGMFWALVGLLLTALVGGGWYARDVLASLATKEEVKVAGGKADFVLDRQIETLVGQISYLERKPNKTSAELEHLRYLRQQLDQLKRVRGS